MKPIYVRTDKNGTRIYHDWTCPRCGGAGQSDKWLYTGKICYECGGTGKRARALVVKEYTPEYAAKLEARRIARQKKYEEEHADEIAAKKAEAERISAEERQRYNERVCREYGCGTDGIGYVLTGKTYPIKEEIKASGGRWVGGVWVCPVAIDAKGVSAVKIDLGTCKNEFGRILSDYALDLIWGAQKR